MSPDIKFSIPGDPHLQAPTTVHLELGRRRWGSGGYFLGRHFFNQTRKGQTKRHCASDECKNTTQCDCASRRKWCLQQDADHARKCLFTRFCNLSREAAIHLTCAPCLSVFIMRFTPRVVLVLAQAFGSWSLQNAI